MARVPKSLELYRRAGERIAGRTHLFGRRPELHAYGVSPIYSDEQRAGHFRDVDGFEYIDYNMGAGAVLLGHAYPPVVRAVQEQAARGTGLTINHPLELEAADLLAGMVPCAEMVRFCKGGGEADAIAVRIARAATGRETVLFCGYHGWHDWYLAANLSSTAGIDRYLLSGIAPAGVPPSLAGSVVPFFYNDLPSLEAALAQNAGDVACIILEPARSFLPAPGFLASVRDLATRHGAILIFDEVVTGFRLARGGAQEHFGVTPDIATFAKCISNGFALGAVGGRRDVMEAAGHSFISSVYWAEATGLAACRATLCEYRAKDICSVVAAYGAAFVAGVRRILHERGLPFEVIGPPAFPTLSFQGVDAALVPAITTLYMQECAIRGLFGGPAHLFCSQHNEADLVRSLSIVGEAMAVVRTALDDGAPEKFLQCPVRQSGFRRLV
jgi:glutamate-1-semialdehyde 2,1-aminomutase